MIKPFLKWVGGKKQLIKEIRARLPKDYSTRTHIEPFIGGGSVLLYLQPDRARISDYNPYLVSSYLEIGKDWKKIADGVLELKNTKEDYYEVREKFNERIRKCVPVSHKPEEAVIMFLYLNKTGFNGMYRVNGKGELNVPWNHNPHEDMSHFINKRDIEDTSKYICDHVILYPPMSYDVLWEKSKFNREAQFWYLDPPYAPLDKDLERGNFTQYTTYPGWDHDEQVRLYEVCKEIDKSGHKFMLSNSSCTLIKDLYKDFNIQEVDARRSISAKKETRNGCKEVIVTNY